MKKKLAIIISLILVAIFSVNLVAASYKDLDGHWAKDYIDDGGALELFDKREDGSFGANEKLSRAELIQAINRLTGVIEESDISFTDIKEDDPYYKEYKKAVYTGFIEDKADKAEPKKLVSRSEAVAMLAIVYGIDAKEDEGVFNDLEGVKEAGYINALNALGLLIGYPDGTFKPNDNITRAEFISLVAVIYKRLGTPVRYPANYKDADKSELKKLLMNGMGYAKKASDELAKAYEFAYANAKLVLNNKKAIVSEIESACEKLSDAIDAIKEENAETKSDEAKVEEASSDKDELKDLIKMADAIIKMADSDYYKDNYERALENLKTVLKNAKEILKYDEISEEDLEGAKTALEDGINALYADQNAIDEIKDAINYLKDLNKDIKNADVDGLIEEAEKLIVSKPMHDEADAMVYKLDDAINMLLNTMDENSKLAEMMKEALKNLKAITQGRISDLEDKSYTLIRLINRNKNHKDEDEKEKLYKALDDASKVKEAYDNAVQDLKDMSEEVKYYEGLIEDFGLNEKNEERLAVEEILALAKKASRGYVKISTAKISEIWDKLDSIQETLASEIDLDTQISKAEDFIKSNKLSLNKDDAALIDSASDILTQEKLVKEDIDAKKKALEELVTRLYKDIKDVKDAKESIKTADDILKYDSSLKNLINKKKALQGAIASKNNAAIKKANKELNSEIAKILPIKFIYNSRDIEGQIVSFDMKGDMTMDEVKRLVYAIYPCGTGLNSHAMKINVTSETNQDLAVRDASKKIVKFRKPSNKEKIRIKFSYDFAGRTYSATLEYRPEEKAKRFKNILGIYRALEGEAIDEEFFKTYEGAEAALFDTVTSKDVSDELKVKVMKDGKEIELNEETNKLKKGEYDLIFYYLDGKEEIVYEASSKLIVDKALNTKDLLYIFNPDDASYFVPMKNADGRVVFAFDIKNKNFKLPSTVKIFNQDSGEAFLNKDGNSDIKIKFIDAATKDINKKEDIKEQIYLMLLEDVEGSLGDRKITLKTGDIAEVSVIK